ncbi:unnamed protein product [Ilex paraguariensis]|uniref:Uncharacterized protein n=1 Tax=Ilex paraguariensis TaxID=185542 RepID=A0ABC8TCQ2_9AQUA
MNSIHQADQGPADSEGPAWAPLRDNFMLTNSKLKDWDKMPIVHPMMINIMEHHQEFQELKLTTRVCRSTKSKLRGLVGVGEVGIQTGVVEAGAQGVIGEAGATVSIEGEEDTNAEGEVPGALLGEAPWSSLAGGRVDRRKGVTVR